MEVKFREGEEVEVTSKDQGFDGSWYAATIVSFAEKKKQTYIVEYHTLTDETETNPLREIVHVAFIRPPQPPGDPASFEPNEEVDAHFNDGWWQGVVIKALQDKRYLVYFTNTKEEMEFQQSDLRVHMEWVQGTWVRSQDRGKMEPVEVSFDDENCQGAWFPAMVLKEIGNGSFLIEYQTLRFSDDVQQVREIVDSQHVRPSPPNDSVCTKFYLLQKVDAFYDFAWWTGVITKVLDEDTYSVYFKFQNKDKKVNKSELRIHVEWIDNTWLQNCRETSVIQQDQGAVKSPDPIDNSAYSTEMAVQASPSAVKDNLKRKSPEIYTPPLPNKHVLKIKLTSRSSAEASHSCEKLKKGVATKNPKPMKACNVRGTSSGSSTDVEAQHTLTSPVPKGKRSKFHHEGSISPVSKMKEYLHEDHASSSRLNKNEKDNLEHDMCGDHQPIEPKSGDVVETEHLEDTGFSKTEVQSQKRQPLVQVDGLIKQQSVGRPDNQMVNAPKRKRGRPKKEVSSRKIPVKGKKHKKSGRGSPKSLPCINLSTEGTKHEGTYSRETTNTCTQTECAASLDHIAEGHLPIPSIRGKEHNGLGNIRAEAAASSIKSLSEGPGNDSREIADAIVPVECVKLANHSAEESLSPSVLLRKSVSLAGEDNGASSKETVDTNIPTKHVELLSPSAEVDLPPSMLLTNTAFPVGDNRGLSPKIQLMPNEPITEDVLVDSFELQNPLATVDCVYNRGEHIILDEYDNARGAEQNERTLRPFVPNVDRQRDVRDLPQSLPIAFLESADLLNHPAQKNATHSVLLPNSNSTLTEENMGVLPEKKVMLIKAITREDASVEMQELQNSLVVIECSNNSGKQTISEYDNTRGDEQNETAFLSFSVHATTSAVSSFVRQGDEGVVPRNMPFTKSSPLLSLWEYVESMSAFKSIPQQPHFRPLEQYNEEIREGIALGYMASFANLVEKTCSTTLEEPQCSLDEKLKALADLEKLGFQVDPIRSRLREISNIKANYSQIKDDSKVVEEQITTEKHLNSKLEVQIDELQKAITEIEERLHSIRKEKEIKKSNLAELETKQHLFRQSIEEVKLQFANVVASPW